MAKHSKKQKIDKNYLDIVFIPNPERKWSEREDGMVVIDMVNKGFFHSIAQKFFHKPRVSHIALDQYGTTLWKALDGNRNLFDVIHVMEEVFPDEKDRMLDRVVTFAHTLQVNHFICENSIPPKK